MSFSLWKSAENKSNSKTVLSTGSVAHIELNGWERTLLVIYDALTPTILFMASSLSDSLLLSNISLRSSFLRTDDTVTYTHCVTVSVREGTVTSPISLTKGAVKAACARHVCHLHRLEDTHARRIRSYRPNSSAHCSYRGSQRGKVYWQCTRPNSSNAAAAASALHSHDIAMLILWLMLTNTAIV